MSTLELLHLERERRHRERLRVEGPKWDWYGPDCDCPPEARRPNGACPEHPRAREKQRPPQDDTWQIYYMEMGRGAGKTIAGARWVQWKVETGRARSIALVGPTAADVRDTMVLNAILPSSPPWCRAEYRPTRSCVEWANGAVAKMFSADEPERLRGHNSDTAWVDEIASFRYPEAWDMLMFGLRVGKNPQCVVTTTPKPHPWLRRIKAKPGTIVVRGSTYENRDNLAESFFTNIINKYEGTRLGRQEIEAEDLEDAPGALWKNAVLDACRVAKGREPEYVRVAVAVDPSVADHTSIFDDEDTAEAGIVGGGLDDDGHGFLVADRSVKGHPQMWGTAAVNLYHELEADVLVAEVNNGGALVAALIHSIDPNVNVKMVHASRGKRIRAEPVAARYEQGKCHHVGVFPELESQLTGWVPGMKSPDRLDALVWLFTELFEGGAPLTFGEDPFPGYRG